VKKILKRDTKYTRTLMVGEGEEQMRREMKRLWIRLLSGREHCRKDCVEEFRWW